MSTSTPGAGVSTTAAPHASRHGRERSAFFRYRWWIYTVGALVLVSAARIIGNADDVSSSGTLRAAILAAVPIALAGLGGLWSERAGVVNIGLEGMMIMGTLGAGYFGYHYGWIAGVLGGMLLGAVAGLVHAVATVIFGVDHIVSGVAINIITLGLAGFLAELLFTDLPGGGPTQSPTLPKPWEIDLTVIADPAKTVEDKHWFVISDLASAVGALTLNLSVLTILALVLVVGSGWVLWRTPFGLRLRSCGESPAAAESLGVDVYRYKIVAVTISGALAGLGGVFLAMVAQSGFQQNQTGGRGYIGLAAMIFGNWRPGGLLLGSGLFGYTNGVQLRSGGTSLHALLLAAGVVLLVLAVVQLRRGVRGSAVASAVMGAAVIALYFSIDVVPRQFTTMAPYVATLLVLAFASQSLRMPAADGQVYRKGSAG
ncbi:ABC transporter permease [Nocardioides marmoribigeumensis]|uniref:Simple sugar transport system permease protein n=1 Tax=Nocardioides marmoribigeumensis TaxID=433649 RepID=A0ABU2BZW9_9ACTN|nr:ABC transporter permease [Nocardioides marmoribigeumensis]MDR7363952.1 simple sugar transport system permease protein [Nocardioides marmoribigeumensis]